MKPQHIQRMLQRMLLVAAALSHAACGGTREGPSAPAAASTTPVGAGADASLPEETVSRVLSDVTEESRAESLEALKRKEAFENTAALDAPTPVNVEVPVLLDYQHAEVVPQEGHRQPIEHIAVSDDGRLILTASRDNTFKLLTRSGAALLRTFHVQGAPHDAINNRISAFLPGGRRVLCVVGNTATLFETDTGRQLTAFKMEFSVPTYISFTKDGNAAALANFESVVEIRDLNTGALIHNLETTLPGIGNGGPLLLASDGRTLFRGYKNGVICAWDTKNGKMLQQLTDLHSGNIESLRYTQDGGIVSVGTADSSNATEVAVWNPKNGQRRGGTRSISGRYQQVAVMPGEKIAAARSTGGILTVFNLENGIVLSTIKLSISPTRETLAPDGSCVVSTDKDRNVHIFEVRKDTAGGGAPKDNVFKPDKTFRAAVTDFGPLAMGPGTTVALSPGKADVFLWDLSRGFMAQRVKMAYRRPLDAVAMSRDGTLLLIGDRLINLADAKEVGAIRRDYYRLAPRSASFSPDGKRIAVIETNYTASIWDISNPSQLSEPAAQSPITDPSGQAPRTERQIVFSADGSRVLVSGDTTRLLSAEDLSVIRDFPVLSTQAVFFPDGKHVLLTNENDGAMLWTLDGRSPAFTFRSNAQEKLVASALSPDGKRAATLSADGETITLWDTYNRKKLQVLRHGRESWNDVQFLGDAEHIITAGPAALPRVWNLDNGRSAVLMSDGDEWAVCTEDGYFDASRRGGYLLALVQGNRGFRVDQLTIKYNRPDVVLRDLGFGTPELWAHYYEMYKKRLRKMRIEEDRVDQVLAEAPRAVIESVELKGKWVRLIAALSSVAAPLSRYNLYVNEVPIYGIEGQSVSGSRTRVEMIVELTDGINHLEVGVTNRDGIESLRDKYTACYTAEKQKHDLYYVGFGVSNYADATLNLKYAAKDARELSAVFREVYTGYKQVFSKVFTDDRVNVDAFIEAKLFLESAGVDDTVVLFVAGHGLHDPQSGDDYYYLAHDTDIEQLKLTGVPFEAIESLLSDIKPRRKLFLLDTCQSGELDEGDENQILAAAGARGLISRGIRKKNLIGHITPKKSLKQYLEERDSRFIYNDVTRRSGSMVISSSRGSEFSYEKDELQNGVFTEEVYNAFTTPSADRNKDKFLSIDELRDYVFTAVSEHTGGLQHPVVDRDNLELTFEFPIIKTAAPQ